MPRAAKGPRLYLIEREGRRPYWVIRDTGKNDRSTGCFGPELCPEAEQALADYIAEKHEPKLEGRETLIADVLKMYLDERAAGKPSEELAKIHVRKLTPFWALKTVGDVRGQTCRDYVAVRTKERVAAFKEEKRLVSSATARRELVTLGAALRYVNKEHGVPLAQVTLPDDSEAKDRWLTRREAARLIRAARDLGFGHIERFVRLGLYTGTRHEALLGLQWHPNTTGGWVDLKSGLLFRRGQGVKETKKRRPTARLHKRLIPHLERWRAEDEAFQSARIARAAEKGKAAPSAILHIVHWQGRRIEKERRAWALCVKKAGLGPDVTPHVLRHTAITWFIQRGISIEDAASYFGCSPQTITRVYWHQSPHFQKAAAAH